MLHLLDNLTITPHPDFRRLETVLRRGKPDEVPFYELYVNQEIMVAVLDKPIPDRSATVEFYYRAGYDYVPAWPGISLILGSPNHQDEPYPIINLASIDRYPWPRVDEISLAEFEALIPILPSGMRIIGQIGGIFEYVQYLIGFENLCYALHDDPLFVEAVFARLGMLYEAMYSAMAQIDEVGALVISDDMGFKTSTLISAHDLRHYVLPWHQRLAEIAHTHGKPVILHSCGQLHEVMDDWISTVNIDAKHSYEDSILPVEMAKVQYGERIAILGGFDVDRLCRSNESAIRTYTRHLINDLGNQGGYALGSGNSISAYVPPHLYLAMLDEAWKIRS